MNIASITAVANAASRVHFVQMNSAPTSSSTIGIVTAKSAVTHAGSMR